MPLVSILTPSFNQGPWLEDNLRSIQAQTYPNIEQIVMDGGSTDTTLDILKSAEPNVSWTSEPDRGQSHALNKALAKSSGEIIGWINSDDAYADRRSVEAAVRVFQDFPEVGVVYGHGVIIDQANRFLRVAWSPPYTDRLMDVGTPFLQPTVLFRKSLLPAEFVREDLHFVMDWDLFLRLRDNGVQFRRIPLVVGVDRLQPGRKTVDAQATDKDRYHVFESRGIQYNRRVRIQQLLVIAIKRLAGLTLAVTFPSRVDLAIDIDYKSVGRRLLYQGLLPMRKIIGDRQGGQ